MFGWLCCFTLKPNRIVSYVLQNKPLALWNMRICWSYVTDRNHVHWFVLYANLVVNFISNFLIRRLWVSGCLCGWNRTSILGQMQWLKFKSKRSSEDCSIMVFMNGSIDFLQICNKHISSLIKRFNWWIVDQLWKSISYLVNVAVLIEFGSEIVLTFPYDMVFFFEFYITYVS